MFLTISHWAMKYCAISWIGFMSKDKNTEFILDDFLPYNVNVLAQLISRSFSKTYKDVFKVSVPEWRVIAHLSQQNDVSVREISEAAHMPRAKVTRAVQTLASRKLVKKVIDSQDRRLVSLRLTAKGQELVNNIAPLAMEFELNMIKGLPDGLQSQAKPFIQALLKTAIELDAGLYKPDAK